MLHIQCKTKGKLRRKEGHLPRMQMDDKSRREDEAGEASRRRREEDRMLFREREKRGEKLFRGREKTECFRKRDKVFYVFK